MLRILSHETASAHSCSAGSSGGTAAGAAGVAAPAAAPAAAAAALAPVSPVAVIICPSRVQPSSTAFSLSLSLSLSLRLRLSPKPLKWNADNAPELAAVLESWERWSIGSGCRSVLIQNPAFSSTQLPSQVRLLDCRSTWQHKTNVVVGSCSAGILQFQTYAKRNTKACGSLQCNEVWSSHRG